MQQNTEQNFYTDNFGLSSFNLHSYQKVSADLGTTCLGLSRLISSHIILFILPAEHYSFYQPNSLYVGFFILLGTHRPRWAKIKFIPSSNRFNYQPTSLQEYFQSYITVSLTPSRLVVTFCPNNQQNKMLDTVGNRFISLITFDHIEYKHSNNCHI